MRRVGLLLVFSAAAVLAAESLGGPVAGYVAGSPKPELRAIFGVPGALRFSDPLPLPDGITRIRLAPGQDYALVERANASAGALVLAGGSVDHLQTLDGVMARADWVVFSSSGTAAVLFSASAGRLQVVTGLPDAPQMAADLDVAALPELPATAAVDDTAALLLIASRQSVYAVPKAGAPRLVFSGSRIAALAVLRNGKDAAVSDSGAASVFLVENAASAPAARVLASGIEGVGDIFPSQDGTALFAAAGGILWIDLASGAVQSFAAADPQALAAGLVALRNSDTFLFSARSRQPGWIFFREGNSGRVVFVPARSPDRELPARGGVR